MAAYAVAMAIDTDSVQQRIFRFDDPLMREVELCFKNPALRYFQHSVSLSHVFARGETYRENRPVDQLRGDGYDLWNAGAESYMRHGRSSIWGHASYQQGKRRNITLNETADIDMIYPYLTADSIGGDMSSEVYSLAGGYAGSHDKWLYGVQLSYEAGLYYRNVDPRPKNVTGLIRLSVGASYSIAGGYCVGISAEAAKYRQSCDIMFVSEAGKSQILHLTGLGHHYRRFAGTAESCHYDGAEYGAAISLFPTGLRGWALALDFSHFQFNKTLTDLNKLPLCHAWHNAVSAQASYMSGRWSASCRFEAYRRHGIEHLFGDAQSGVYPQIGELPMYADNHCSASIGGACYLLQSGRRALDVSLCVGYRYRQLLYVEPATEAVGEQCFGSVGCCYRAILGNRWNMKAAVTAALATPELTDRACAESRIDYELSHRLSSRYAVGIDVAYVQSRYPRAIKAHGLKAALKFIF